jgi:hypothetical protein
MFTKVIYLVFLCTILNSNRVEKIIDIYCSNDFYFENRTNKICKWLYDNGTSFKDTYQSASQDCPSNHVLATFNKQINGHKVSLGCQDAMEIWINKVYNSNDSYNVLKIDIYGQAHMNSKTINESLEYFLCINKNQTITCESDEYLDEDTLLCMDTVEYNETCLKNEMCNQTSNLHCNLTMNKCICNTTMYWNGTQCSN